MVGLLEGTAHASIRLPQAPISRGVQSVLGCEKLTQARKRVSDLEFARKAFERNAAKGAPIPGASVVSESVATQD